MKTEPITAARIDWSGEVPLARDFGDIYHPQVGPMAQAEHVFLQGNGLPVRWQGRERFTILETGFGLGFNFLATWAAWRSDAARPARLHFVSVEKHPPRLEDLQRAHAILADPDLARLAAALRSQWPALTPNLHPLTFDEGRVRLTLAFGDVSTLLPALELEADAIYLDGFAPDRNAAMWSAEVLEAIGRKTASNATAATWSVARELRDGLTRAGFVAERAPGIGGKREITVARHVPRPGVRRPPSLAVSGRRDAIVVGAGIAGAATAHALLGDGWEVTVFERRPAAAGETSSNLGGLFHGGQQAADGPHARLLRTAALLAANTYAPRVVHEGVPGAVQGLLWVDRRAGGLPALQALQQRTGLPNTYVHSLGAAEAAALAGVPLDAPAWCYPAGGWISPMHMTSRLLQGCRFVGGTEVARLERHGPHWRVYDASGQMLGEAGLVVLCAAAAVPGLLAPLLGAQALAWPLQSTRGQVSVLERGGPTPLAMPLTGDGYALPLANGQLLIGATRQAGDDDATVRAADHLYNVDRAARLMGLAGGMAPVLPRDASAWSGRVGWRLHTSDRLPVAGAVAAPGARATQPRLLERIEGLFVVTALGSRGLTLAPLLGRAVAAMAGGLPWPLERDLAAAIDPGRWAARSAPNGPDERHSPGGSAGT